MSKTILITGATDGIGLETAKVLVARGHRLLIHGRNEAKLARICGRSRGQSLMCHLWPVRPALGSALA